MAAIHKLRLKGCFSLILLGESCVAYIGRSLLIFMHACKYTNKALKAIIIRDIRQQRVI